MGGILLGTGRAIAEVPDETTDDPVRLIGERHRQGRSATCAARNKSRYRRGGGLHVDLPGEVGRATRAVHREGHVVETGHAEGMRRIEFRGGGTVAKVPVEAGDHAAGQIGELDGQRHRPGSRVRVESR